MTNEYDLLDKEELREECIILSDALDQAIDEALEVRRQSGIHPNNFRETPAQMRKRLYYKAMQTFQARRKNESKR